MTGRHDKAGDRPSPVSTSLLSTVVRGMSRGIVGALRPQRGSRHRAPVGDDRQQVDLAEHRFAEADSGSSTGAVARMSGPLEHDRRARPEASAGGEEQSVGEDRSNPPDERGSECPEVVGEPTDERIAEKTGSSIGGDEAVAEPAGEPERSSGGPTEADLSARTPEGVANGSASDAPAGRPTGSRGDIEARAERERAAAFGEPFVEDRHPRGSRFSRETIGVAVLVVLAIVCAGLITAVVVKTRSDAALAAREAADYTPPPLSTSAPAAGPAVAVIGDETASRAGAGVTTSKRWPALLGTALRSQVDVTARAGAGYTSKGSSGDTFVQLAAEVPTDADVVVFVGGASDTSATSLDLAKAATRAFSAAADRAPDAVVVVVGPLFTPADTDADRLEALRTTLRSSARIAGIRWVDPVASSWLRGVSSTAGLTASTERSIATRLRSVVESPSP